MSCRKKAGRMVCSVPGCKKPLPPRRTRTCSDECAAIRFKLRRRWPKRRTKCVHMWCRRSLPAGRQKWCSDACLARSLNARRRKPLRLGMANGFVLRARRQVKGRVCLMCMTEPLKGSQRVLCSRPECRRDYMAEYKREQRAKGLAR